MKEVALLGWNGFWNIGLLIPNSSDLHSHVPNLPLYTQAMAVFIGQHSYGPTKYRFWVVYRAP